MSMAYSLLTNLYKIMDKEQDINNADHPSRKKAIEILEAIAEKMGNEDMFDCKNGNTTWYDLEDLLTNIIEKDQPTYN